MQKGSFTNNEDTQKLYNYIYQGCNILRGPIYPEEYKTYIFPLLFYKRLCDEYSRELNDALEIADGDMQYALFRNFIVFKYRKEAIGMISE